MQFLESLPLDLQSYLILGGVAVILIALLFYLLPISKTKMPAILASSLGALALGTGLGMVAMAGFGYRLPAPKASTAGSEETTIDPRTKSMQSMLKGKGGDMAKGSGGGMSKGGATKGGRGPAPSAKSQLASLVAKLDLLTGKALTLDLSKGEKGKVAEQLKGLEESKELSEDEAKQKLDTLLDVLKSHKETFEAAGYRWPGQPDGGSRPAAGAGNPFQEKENAQHLKSLQGRL
jgi:hypothetical protein